MKPAKARQQQTATRAKTGKRKTPDEYLAALSDDKRAALEKLRQAIKAAAPEAEECISYQLPAFRLNGKLLVAYGAVANHCAFYPGSMLASLKDELTNYDTSKGTIRFAPNKPLPHALVRNLVKLRIAKNPDLNKKRPGLLRPGQATAEAQPAELSAWRSRASAD